MQPERDEMLMIDSELRVRPLGDLVRGQLPLPADPGGVQEPQDAAIPVSPDGTLAPGGVYPSCDGTPVVYGMPAYALTQVAGRYTSSLRWRSTEDDPNGPIAFLSVSITGVMPAAAPGTTMLPLPHDVVGRLLYSVPVRSQDGQASPATADFAVDLAAFVPQGDGSLVLRHAISDKADFDRIWTAVTSPGSGTRIELRCHAMIGRRTWRVILPDWSELPIERLQAKGVVLSQLATPQVVRLDQHRLPPIPVGVPIGQVPVAQVPIEHLPSVPVPIETIPIERLPILTRAPLDDVPAMPSIPLDRLDPQVHLRRADVPELGDALDASDLEVGGRPAIPVRVLTGPDRRPVIVRTAAQCVQTLDFAFDVELNASMFDVPGDLRPTAHRLLIRSEFDAGGGRPLLTYYTDSALPGTYYYQPSEFRIPRDDDHPYLPHLRLAFHDVLEQSAGGAGDADVAVTYRVRMVYKAVPYLDRFTLAELRRHLTGPAGGEPNLSVLLPQSVSLAVLLPSQDAGGAVTAQTRPDAETAFDAGIVDEVDLSAIELAGVVAMLRTTGVDGTVSASLLDASSARVPLRLSLRETAGTPFGRAFRGPVSPGVVRVSVHNWLESPVLIEELYRSPAGAGAVAYPLADPGLVIPAGGQIDLDYRVVPPDADVLDVEPMLRLATQTDLARLLPQLMTNEGYSGDTFTVPVTLDPAYLGQVPPGQSQPLTGLVVDFDCGVSVVLDGDHLSVPARLRIPILGWLLGAADAARYRYRVTNVVSAPDGLHSGPPGPWLPGVGEATLPVVPLGA